MQTADIKEESSVQAGFVYVVEHIRNGEILSVEEVHNLIPTEGLNYILNTALKAASAVPAWYLALFEGNYTPVAAVTAATFPAAATESTAYNETNRVLWAAGPVASGAVSNSASKAVFTMNATKAIYGIAQTSVLTKSATTGVLVSVARFAAVKNVENGDVLNVTSSLSMTSV